MKAILTLSKSSSKTLLEQNFRTFEVVEVGTTFISLKGVNSEFPNNQVDFSFDEVLIIDIDKELQNARENRDWYGDYEHIAIYRNLYAYCSRRGITTHDKWVPVQ